MFTIKIILEVAIVLLIAYGIWHEDELIEFEQVLKWYIKKKIKGVLVCGNLPFIMNKQKKKK